MNAIKVDLSLFIIIYHYLLLFIIIYYYLLLFIIIYYYLLLFLFKCLLFKLYAKE
jgi:hypothetical protein